MIYVTPDPSLRGDINVFCFGRPTIVQRHCPTKTHLTRRQRLREPQGTCAAEPVQDGTSPSSDEAKTLSLLPAGREARSRLLVERPDEYIPLVSRAHTGEVASIADNEVAKQTAGHQSSSSASASDVSNVTYAFTPRLSVPPSHDPTLAEEKRAGEVRLRIGALRLGKQAG